MVAGEFQTLSGFLTAGGCHSPGRPASIGARGGLLQPPATDEVRSEQGTVGVALPR